MNQAANNSILVSSTPPHVAGNQPEVLHQILDSGVNLSLWERPTQASVIHELSSFHASDLPNARCRTSLESFDDDISTLLLKEGHDPSTLKHWRVDLRRLADLYFSLSGGRKVTMRLETSADDGCRRLHVDNTHLRLLCTYRGPGTEWLPNEQVDRLAQSTGAPNEEIIRSGKPSRFESFCVGIMKGNAYPGNAGNGLVHRSPPIEGSGQTRVVFCLDC